MKVTNDVFYVGVNDHQLDLFEGQYIVPNGMAYNSYLIVDEKTCVMDSVEKGFEEEWFKNIDEVLGGKDPTYLLIQHMEPDHSSSIVAFMNKYPTSLIVSNQKAFNMMKNFYGTEFIDRRVVIVDKGTLSLGKHELSFVAAPMVHWPEVMMSYDSYDKIFFSADAFGKFGALDVEEEDWACEARRYYFGIVGKYGQMVQLLFGKIASLDIQIICPLHGPVLSENLPYYLGLYKTWSTYGVETEGVAIFYTSVYGNTKKAVELLEEKLIQKGAKKVVVNDLARMDMAEAVEDAFRYGKIVLATTTYNSEIFPFMREFIADLVERGVQNKTIGMIENGSWAPQPIRIMRKMLENCKNITYTENNVKILSSVKEENLAQIEALATELAK